MGVWGPPWGAAGGQAKAGGVPRALLAGPGCPYHWPAWPVKEQAQLGSRSRAKGLSSILSFAPAWPAGPASPPRLVTESSAVCPGSPARRRQSWGPRPGLTAVPSLHEMRRCG